MTKARILQRAGSGGPARGAMRIVAPPSYIEPAVTVRPGAYELWGRYSESFFDMLKDEDTDMSGFSHDRSSGRLRVLAERLMEKIGEGYWNGKTCRWEFPATPKARDALVEFGLLPEDSPVPAEEKKEEPADAGSPPARREIGIRLTSGKAKLIDGKIHVPFSRDEEFRKNIQAMPGVSHDKWKREWIAPETGAAARILAGMGLAEPEPEPDLTALPGLFPYQTEGVKRLCGKGLCAILSDPPGAGKTVEALGAAIAMGALPCAILCPKAKAKKWMADIARFFPNASAERVDREEKAQDGIEKLMDADFYVCDFESLKARGYLLAGYRCVIVDECHRLDKKPVMEGERDFAVRRADVGLDDFASREEFLAYRKSTEKLEARSSRWRLEYDSWNGWVWRLLEKAYHRIFVSAFPLERKPMKYYEILKFLCPDRIGSIRDFGNKYCRMKPSDWAPTGFTYLDASNPHELWEAVKGAFVRREMREIEGQVPEGFFGKKK